MAEDIRIRMVKTVRPDLAFLIPPEKRVGTILISNNEYDAVSNQHGAISGICENGEHIGVKPDEFEFLEAPEWVLQFHKKFEMIRLQKELEQYRVEAGKIPSICSYRLSDTCGFGEIKPYDICPSICPRYKGES
jgi:hypothetical protein